LLILSITLPTITYAEIQFDEKKSSGFSYRGSSWGASWGEFNGDGWPDLFTSNHGGIPSIFLNNANGTFTDIALELKLDKLRPRDQHGAAWADFDNDGDQDLIVLQGSQRGEGVGSNHFLINHNYSFVEEAASFGLEYPLGRGRTPIWFDSNLDGLLDVLVVNQPRPDNQASTALFSQNLGSFQPVSSFDGIDYWWFSSFAMISDLSNNGKMEPVYLIEFFDTVYQINNFPLQSILNVYNESSKFILGIFNQPFKDIFVELNLPLKSDDMAIADFNGDSRTDIILTKMREASVVVEDENKILAHLLSIENEREFSFRTLGDLSFELYPGGIEKFEILLGSGGSSPLQNHFTLSPKDPKIWGIAKPQSFSNTTVHIGFDTDNQIWMVQFFPTQTTGSTNILIESEQQITELTNFKLKPSRQYAKDKFLLNSGDGLKDASSFFGLKNPTSCRSVVSGDFDNDMDLDVYLVCTLSVKNLPNILYENLGNGTFVKVPEAGGAEGSIFGVGDSVTTVDFDRDGFLDLFVTNGLGAMPFRDEGPYQIFRNLGNDNQWLEIDLVGTVSNRDGIGSRVLITTGEITQLREQNGGVHAESQNHQRIHVGLGMNTVIDKIEVFWPSGKVQEIKNVRSNQILQIVEPTDDG